MATTDLPITHLSIGSVALPSLEPGVPIELKVPLDRPMPVSNYTVSILSPGSIDDVTLVRQDTASVTLRLMSPAGRAGAATVRVVAVRHADQDDPKPPKK